ncbi:MAG: DEAD/DEAH box helicase, partial [Fibrobacteria bacterium]|nr:DEAD/DEAH box helicase [Fibrobacteria bacterium]
KVFMLHIGGSGGLEIETHILNNDTGRSIVSLENETPGFGDARYVPGEGFFATEVKESLTSRRFCGWSNYKIPNKDVVSFLKKFSDEINDPELYFKGREVDVMLAKAEITGIQLSANEKQNSRYLFGIVYQLGSFVIDVQKLLEEREKGQKCVFTPSGWIDLEDNRFFWLRSVKKEDMVIEGERTFLWMGRSRALRVFNLFNPEIISFDYSKYPALQALKPSQMADDEISQEPHIGHLRSYQKEGFKWLAYLYLNNISGILADEMGLGKTHQVMALIQRVVHQQTDARILVVCPTSVIYHWRDKFAQFYPDVSVTLFHSQQRQWDETTQNKQVLVTSYGIVRNDIELFESLDFNLLVLDEIQLSKNKDTEIYKALSRLRAGAWVGLSGTPIENSTWELKNIFDLILPGYFPDKKEFAEEIASRLDEAECPIAQAYLLQLIRPFVLRRVKSEVLTDLPEKVEEIYKCEMVESQQQCYNQNYENQEVVEDLKTGKPTVSYMHIFALLNRLKQICNHPGSLEENFSRFKKLKSGKWKLCRELLKDALGSGLKVVVFSQYLNMLSILEEHLKSLDTGYAVLTGATRHRDRVLKRFQEDEDCKVFLCSLKAGGAGIDLTAASVVIHYDRWWNAAREDQATGRVHRIGQQRNVQVFKLVTINSIEERIDAIIARKARLAESLLNADLTTSLKLFSREELLEILSIG